MHRQISINLLVRYFDVAMLRYCDTEVKYLNLFCNLMHIINIATRLGRHY